MTAALFTNEVVTQADQAAVRKVLLAPTKLPLWATEVTRVTAVADDYLVERTDAALNSQERLHVSTTDDQVTYQSYDGRVDYRVVFTLKTQESQTLIQEAFYLTTSPSWLPVQLLAPIAKHAFHQELAHLAVLAGQPQ